MWEDGPVKQSTFEAPHFEAALGTTLLFVFTYFEPYHRKQPTNKREKNLITIKNTHHMTKVNLFI